MNSKDKYSDVALYHVRKINMEIFYFLYKQLTQIVVLDGTLGPENIYRFLAEVSVYKKARPR